MLFLSTVWPEPHSSAAGVRTAALLRAFARAGYDVAVGASAARNEASAALESGLAAGLSRRAVACFETPLNRAEKLDAALSACDPTVVVFDRFTSEEAFSWRVKERLPEAARVLDMQDCHALRRARARAVEEADKRKRGERSDDSASAVSAALAARLDASDKDAVREASAVYRSDLTLVCSPVEGQILRASLGSGGGSNDFERLFVPAPLFASRPALSRGRRRSFEGRRHFVAIGSFLHPPNVDSLLWRAGRRRGKGGQGKGTGSKRRGGAVADAPGCGGESGESGEGFSSSSSSIPIWDLLAALPGMEEAELHVFGSYASKSPAAAEVHDPARRVFVHGRAPNLAPLARARVLLAPLRYGAGLKGKVADAWMRGTPVVTTPIGGEGMEEEEYEEEEEVEGEDDDDDDDGGRQRRKRRARPLLLPWGGSRTSETASAFAAEAARLYLDERAWTEASEEGMRLHDALYFSSRPADAAVAAVDALVSGSAPPAASHSSSSLLSFRRSRDFVGAALWADSARATEYFSRWIELKEKEKEKQTV